MADKETSREAKQKKKKNENKKDQERGELKILSFCCIFSFSF